MEPHIPEPQLNRQPKQLDTFFSPELPVIHYYSFYNQTLSFPHNRKVNCAQMNKIKFN